MKEYIERDAALKNQRWNGRLDEYVVFVRDIEAIPAADVVDARPGRWVYKPLWQGADAKYVECSECHKPAWWATDYCPNCGAKMDGGADDE